MIDIERLASVMRERRVSQGALARAVGVSPPAIQQILNGSTRYTRHLSQIASFLGVSQSWLEGTSDKREPEILTVAKNIVSLPYIRLRDMLDESKDFETDHIYIDKRILPIEESDIGETIVVMNDSDDMVPTIYKGSVMMITFRAQEETIDRQDGIWVIYYHGIPMVRRVRLISKDRAALVPDNTTKPVIEGSLKDDIQIGGRVLWVGQALG